MALPVGRDHLGDFPNEHLGEIKNHLGILIAGYNHFSPRLLLEACPNVTDLAEMLGIQRTQLYTDRISLKKGTKLRKRIIQLVIATDLAYHLLGQSKEKTLHWLATPNLIFFGDTPLEVIMRDEGEIIISWLMEREGLKPGSAF